jgi:hypothetical protein
MKAWKPKIRVRYIVPRPEDVPAPVSADLCFDGQYQLFGSLRGALRLGPGKRLVRGSLDQAVRVSGGNVEEIQLGREVAHPFEVGMAISRIQPSGRA